MFRSFRTLPRTVAAFVAGVVLATVSMASGITLASAAPTGPRVTVPFLDGKVTTVYGGTVHLSRETVWSPAVLVCEPPGGEPSIMLGEHDLALLSAMVEDAVGSL